MAKCCDCGEQSTKDKPLVSLTVRVWNEKKGCHVPTSQAYCDNCAEVNK